MTTSINALSTRITKSWQQAKYPQVINQLSKIPRDTVLETLVCIADEVTPEKRLALLERIDPNLLDDGAVLDILGL